MEVVFLLGEYSFQDKEKYIHNIFTEIAPKYEWINHILCFNLDRLWRRQAVSHFLRSSHLRILDACCGTGELTEILWQKQPSHGYIIGVDFCENMLTIARNRHRNRNNIRYEVANIQHLRFPSGSFDAVYNCFALRNLGDTSGAIREMCRVIKPGGQLIIIDFTLPEAPIWNWYVKHVVPLIGWLCHGDGAPYTYLSASIRRFCQSAALRDRLTHEGLEKVEYISFLGGVVTAVCGTIKRNK
jgi:demethylmenaquinone methyltransferase/2-methoxy-6-polyprenyl-1,4-benzoquinol methylase